jgi:hypothetical protein
MSNRYGYNCAINISEKLKQEICQLQRDLEDNKPTQYKNIFELLCSASPTDVELTTIIVRGGKQLGNAK